MEAIRRRRATGAFFVRARRFFAFTALLLLAGSAVPSNGQGVEAGVYDADIAFLRGKVGSGKFSVQLLHMTGNGAGAATAEAGEAGPAPISYVYGCLTVTRSTAEDYGCATMKTSAYATDPLMDRATLSFTVRLAKSKLRVPVSLTYTSITNPELDTAPFYEVLPAEGSPQTATIGGQVSRKRTGGVTGTISAGSYYGSGSVRSASGSLFRFSVAAAQAAAS